MPGESLFCLNRREVGLRAKSRVINSINGISETSRCRVEFLCKFSLVDYGWKTRDLAFASRTCVYPVILLFLSCVIYKLCAIHRGSIDRYLSCTDQQIFNTSFFRLSNNYFFERALSRHMACLFVYIRLNLLIFALLCNMNTKLYSRMNLG